MRIGLREGGFVSWIDNAGGLSVHEITWLIDRLIISFDKALRPPRGITRPQTLESNPTCTVAGCYNELSPDNPSLQPRSRNSYPQVCLRAYSFRHNDIPVLVLSKLFMLCISNVVIRSSRGKLTLLMLDSSGKTAMKNGNSREREEIVAGEQDSSSLQNGAASLRSR